MKNSLIKLATRAAAIVGGILIGGAVAYAAAFIVPQGGTGQTTFPAGSVLLGNATSPISSVAPGTSGNLLTSNGSSWISSAFTAGSLTVAANSLLGNPTGASAGAQSVATSSLNLNASVITAGTLGVANGGTGSTTLSGILKGNGTSGVGTLLVGSGLSYDGTTLSSTASGGVVGSGSTGQFPYYAANGTTLTATSSIILKTNQNVSIGTSGNFGRLRVDTPNPGEPILRLSGTVATGVSGVDSALLQITPTVNITTGNIFWGIYNLAKWSVDATTSISAFNNIANDMQMAGTAYLHGSIYGFESHVINIGSGTGVDTAVDIQMQDDQFSSPGVANLAVGNRYDIRLAGRTTGTSTTAGILVGEMAGSGSNVGLELGSVSPPAGNFGLYNTSNYNNYFKTNTGFGSTTPGSLLSVGTTAGINFYDNATSTFQKGIQAADFCTASKCLSSITGGGGSGTVNSGTTGQFPYYAGAGTAVTATSTLFLTTSGQIGISTTTNAYATVTQNPALNVAGSIQLGRAGSSGNGFNVIPTNGNPDLGYVRWVGASNSIFQVAVSSGAGELRLSADASSATAISFYGRNSKEIGRFDLSTANLGVGTTTPWGQISASSTAAYPALLAEQHGSGAAGIFLGGNVGISTTSPGSLFSIGAAGTGINFYDNATSTFQKGVSVAALNVGSLSGFLKATAGYITTALVDLTSNVTGILPVGNGGLGVANPTAGAVLVGNGSSAIAPSTNLYFDGANVRLGVGSSTPQRSFVASSTASQECSLADGATITMDLRFCNQARVTLSATGRTFNFAHQAEAMGQPIRVVVCQDGSGSETITTWDSSIRWAGGAAPTLTTTANKCDVVAGFTTMATGTPVTLMDKVLSF